MGNHLIGLTNYAETATLTTGTGGSAPARDEATPFVMELAMTADRLTFWRSASTPTSPVNFDLDLGSSKAVTAIGLLGYRSASLAAATSVTVYSSSTATYPRTWSARGSFSMTNSPRDNGAVISSVSARYWRFEIACTSQFQVAKVWLGNPTDLGGVGLAGGLTSPYQNRNEQPLMSGSVIMDSLGYNGREFTISFGPATSARRNYFENITNKAGSFLLVDPDEVFYEVYAPQGRTDQSRRFYASGTGYYDLAVRLLRCP